MLQVNSTMELEDTVDHMISDNYEDRFKAEYWQTKIRCDKLQQMLVRHEAGTLDFVPKCSIETLNDQVYYMNEYLRVLKVRAEIEGISLEDPKTSTSTDVNIKPEEKQAIKDEIKGEIKDELIKEIKAELSNEPVQNNIDEPIDISTNTEV